MIYLLIVILTTALRCADTPATAGAPERAAAEITVASTAATEQAARSMLDSGRFFRAALLYRDHMRAQSDTTPATILAAARAAIGWGDWTGAERLLADRPWLAQHPEGWALLGHARFSLDAWEGAAAALRLAIAAAERLDTHELALARARLAYALGQLGEHQDAAAEYERARDALPAISEWLGLFAAFSAARSGAVADADARLDALEPDLAREWGWRARVEARTASGDTAAAIDQAEFAAAAIQQATRKAEAFYSAGTLRQALGDRPAARSAFRRAINASQGSGSARLAARALFDIGGLGADDELLVGRTLIRHGDIGRGSLLLRSYLQAGHGSASAREALRYELGDALFRGGQYRDAEAALIELTRATANRARAASAHFLAGRAQYRDGRQAQGRATFEAVAAQHAGEAAAARALFFAADLLHDDEELARARTLYRRAVESGRGDVEEVGLAAMRLGGIAWVERDFEAARREYERYLERFPQGRVAQQATYWSGRAHAELGDDEAARRRMEQVMRTNPLSWYAALAADHLGRAFPAIALPPGPQPRTELSVERGLQRIDLLRLVGWKQAADFEIERLRRQHQHDDGALYAIAEMLNERGLTTTGIGIGWELQRRAGAWNERLIRLVYPFPFRALIIEEAQRRGVDPFLAAGLIRQESMFHASAVSPAGAIGLMQVMPETGRAIARSLGVERFTADMLERPELNVQLGMAFLADQLGNYGERIDAVLAAYNAGPHRVERWRRFPEWNLGEQFAERIPFAETRGYVKVVQANARIYQALYGR